MKKVSFIITLFLFVKIGYSQLESTTELVCDIRDTLSVFTEKLILRKKPSVKSNIVATINFGEQVRVIDSPFGFEDCEDCEYVGGTINNRLGRWLRVSYMNLSGYLFSGYLTKLEISRLNMDTSFIAVDPLNGDTTYYDHPCFGYEKYLLIQWLESIVKKEMVYRFEKTYLSNDPEGFGAQTVFSKYYEDGTTIYCSEGYDLKEYYYETFELGFNDFLNLLEYYASYIENLCLEYTYEDHYAKPEIMVTGTKYSGIAKIECPSFGNLQIKRIGLKLICSIDLLYSE